MKVSALVILAIVAAVHGISSSTGGFDCTGKPNGVYPNVEDCKTFYKCSNDYTHLYDCPDGLHFDTVGMRCEWPHIAKCGGNDDCDGKGPGWWNGKDCNGHNHGDLYPDPFDCGSFYQCSWGTAYYFKCPSILHFNDKIKVCDWPWDADCIEKCPSEPSPLQERVL